MQPNKVAPELASSPCRLHHCLLLQQHPPNAAGILLGGCWDEMHARGCREGLKWARIWTVGIIWLDRWAGAPACTMHAGGSSLMGRLQLQQRRKANLHSNWQVAMRRAVPAVHTQNSMQRRTGHSADRQAYATAMPQDWLR